ncbi:MAG: transcriptional repressor LexA [Proteobacteria bacterium]|nr:transcriptional repressor LexA [Pseudomonadota bacterium]
MKKTGLTLRQMSVLNFLKEYLKEHGYPPSLRDICAAFGIKGAKNARKHLEALERKGFISRHPNRSRAIEILGPAIFKEAAMHKEGAVTSLPIVGHVRAGAPHMAVEDVVGHVALDTAFFDAAGAFVLKVEGDSMIGAGIAEGDHLVVRPGTEVANKDIVVAMLNGEATVKRFFKRGTTVTLAPENQDFAPIEITEDETGADTDFSIVGKVVHVIKSV